MPARLLIIALDGADGKMLERGSADGTLPNLASLRARGQGWALSARPGTTDDALWASFHYGVDTGEHGLYNYLLQDGSGKNRYVLEDHAARNSFWDDLAEQGAVAVFDLPKSRRPRRFGGIHLADWLTHGRLLFPGPLSYPEKLAGEVVARFGAAPPSRCGYAQKTPLDDAAVLEVKANLLRAVDQKRQAGLHYLAQRPWDLFMIGFKEMHCVSHMFWEFNDSGHHKHDAARAARLGNPVPEILRAQDAAIGALLSQAGPDTAIIVFSTSDFAPNGSITHLMARVAARINRVCAAEDGVGRISALLSSLRKAPPYCRLVPVSDDAAGLRVPYLDGETEARRNQRMALISALARELVTPQDGVPVISAVSYPATEQQGSRAHNLPHILLHYRPNMRPSVVSSARLGRIAGPAPDIRTGNHAPGGFAIACGPGAGKAAAEIRTMADFASHIMAFCAPAGTRSNMETVRP